MMMMMMSLCTELGSLGVLIKNRTTSLLQREMSGFDRTWPLCQWAGTPKHLEREREAQHAGGQ